MESEFFGHRKGSFTGAISDNPGLFQAAQGGTLFLDEIADLPLSMQAKLLRAIQERTIRPVGSHEEIPIGCRILSATHQDLSSLVAKGSFREDLFYRINVIEINVPTLRSRREDIPELINHFVQNIAKRNAIPAPSISSDCVKALSEYPFPGNIRELENILERALALSEDEILTAADLNISVARTTDNLTSYSVLRLEDENLDEFMQRIEKQEIIGAMEKCGNSKTKAAEYLGISFRSFRYKWNKFCSD
jgi:two-component system response regulator PilR (NtrC family)